MPFEDGIGSGRPHPADGTEGSASIILTLKDKQEPLELNGCIIANDENFKKLFEDDTILEQHEKTKFFIYFCCHENLKLSNLVETEIKVHRFTKPDRDKHCTIKHATDGVFFLQKECHVFLPVCHKDLKTRVFKEFCKNHSKKIPSQCHPIAKGRYKGTRKVTLPEKGSVKFVELTLTSRSGRLFMEDSSFNKLVDGPLLLHSNEVVGYYNKVQDGSRMTVYMLGSQGVYLNISKLKKKGQENAI
ncbi:hypothetical protein AC249_AIPGENE9946 [Exaiptasia diaphana]|nr:hypothetical protein AC249_AIPGENE9946 [Exaiptasia diaphana]